MKQVVFKMKLKPGCEAEYKKRHKEIWPDLVTLLKANGIKEYRIFFDKEADMLIAIQEIDESITPDLKQNPLMIKWWAHMADLMGTNPDKSPVVVGLEEVFLMP
jgi:L-rhamnose mutarotase